MLKLIKSRKMQCLIMMVILIAVLLVGCSDPTLPPVAETVDISLTLSGSDGATPFLKDVTFSAAESTVSIDVFYQLESIDIELKSELKGFSLTIDDNVLVAGSTVSILLSTGKNVISVSVTPDGGNAVIYILNITRAELPAPPVLSDEASLSALVLNPGFLAPVFSTSTFLYTATVSLDTSSVTLTPTAADSTALIMVNSIETASGIASASVSLSPGENTIEVDVTAEDGETELTYTLLITRLETADTNEPVITLSGGAVVNLEVYDEYIEPGFSAIDDEEGDLSSGVVITGLGSLNTALIGSYTLEYNVSDSSGNAAAAQSRTVVVEDTTPPVIMLMGSESITVPADTDFDDPGAIVTDNYDSDLTASVSGSVDTSTPGEYTLTYNAVDLSGNAATPVTLTVTVFEPIELAGTLYLYTEHPEIMDFAKIVISSDSLRLYKQNNDVVIDTSIVEYDNDSNYLIAMRNGDRYHRITWVETANDVYAITSFEPQNDIDSARIVEDIEVTEIWYADAALTVPVLQMQGAGSIELYEGDTYKDSGALVKDWGITTEVWADVDLDGLTPASVIKGEYTLTYSYTDTDANSAVPENRSVNVSEEAPLELTEIYRLDEDNEVYMLIEMNETAYSVTIPEYGIIDSGTVAEYDNDANEAIVYSTPQDAFYRIEWTDAVEGVFVETELGPFLSVEAASGSTDPGNSYTAYSTVADVPPYLSLVGDETLYLNVGDAFTDEGATVIDWGAVNSTVYASSLHDLNVTSTESGTYTLEYTVMDGDFNNAVPIIRTVIVGSGVAEIIIQ